MSTKKGILFYGPPGTGKTNTIHYLARSLEGHTMLLITAEQVGLLSEYMTLARLLEPSIVVIEDVDLIASDRAQLGTCEEVLLNKLLNEIHLERNGDGCVLLADVENALDEMLFSGGSLNLRLLGAEGAEPAETPHSDAIRSA